MFGRLLMVGCGHRRLLPAWRRCCWCRTRKARDEGDGSRTLVAAPIASVGGRRRHFVVERAVVPGALFGPAAAVLPYYVVDGAGRLASLLPSSSLLLAPLHPQQTPATAERRRLCPPSSLFSRTPGSSSAAALCLVAAPPEDSSRFTATGRPRAAIQRAPVPPAGAGGWTARLHRAPAGRAEAEKKQTTDHPRQRRRTAGARAWARGASSFGCRLSPVALRTAKCPVCPARAAAAAAGRLSELRPRVQRRLDDNLDEPLVVPQSRLRLRAQSGGVRSWLTGGLQEAQRALGAAAAPSPWAARARRCPPASGPTPR